MNNAFCNEMKVKRLFCIVFLFLFVIPAFGKHIIGGEMSYEYLGKGSTAGMSKYKITLKLFRDQYSPADAAPMPINVFVGIFSNDNRAQYPSAGSYYDVTKTNEVPVIVNPFPSCISNPPRLSYHAGLYVLTVDLPDNEKGYTAAYQTCCRISPLTNVNTFGGNGTGATYSCEIPAVEDNSPLFNTSIDAICGGKPFSLDFSASDVDRDSLVYGFAPAFDGGAFQNASNGNPAPPPYGSVPYIGGYTELEPLGREATIDPNTGIISGIAPDVGRYVVCVSVKSYKEGKLVNEHRKDFIVNVTNCDFAGAKLDPKPVSCDGFNVQFSNDDFSPLNKTFYWEFGDPASGTFDTSTLENPVHIYSDTGVYHYKLVVNRGQECSDSAIQTVKVYPGFFPEFDVDGRCIESEIRFTDRSTTNYGEVDTWNWKFNDNSNAGDTSREQNPRYTFKNPGSYQVALSITSTLGCNKDISKTVEIVETPPLELTSDTVICSIDELRLTAIGKGKIEWTPNYNIDNTASFTPLVTPKRPVTYVARLEESRGCVAYDSVFVDVVERVDLVTFPDTTICLTDTIRLSPVSNGLHYSWTGPNSFINNDTLKSPLVSPGENTTYTVTATIGKCSTSGEFVVNTVPYPAAKANGDVTICYSESIQLLATGGSRYSWSPKTYLTDASIANPISRPEESMRYIVEVNDDLGCPKPAFDTVNISVEKLVADAGPRDTSVVVNQPLQLQATGAEFFTWSPAKGLNDSLIANPVAILSEDQEYVVKIISEAGCVDFDTINVKVYKVKPGLYVPNAFTPDGDGVNDIFKPILIGMKSLKYFSVYNRAGQLVFTTSVINEGWNGYYKGVPQDSGVYVWMVEGEDYQGNRVFEKGTMNLIR